MIQPQPNTMGSLSLIGQKYKPLSPDAIAKLNIPEIEFYIQGILRKRGKASLIAPYKHAKSFLAVHCGMCVGGGITFLDRETKQATVLYVNCEIDEGVLDTRIQDLESSLKCNQSRFIRITELEGFALDKETKKLRDILNYFKLAGPAIEVLMLDTRIKTMEGDENRSEIVNEYTKNLDQLIEDYGVAILVVHHAGKNPKKGGRGSSVWEGWLDTIITLEAPYNSAGDPDLTNVAMTVIGRDGEPIHTKIKFNYPLYVESPEAFMERQTKVDLAKTFIKSQQLPMDVKELRKRTFSEKHSNYAFQNALNQLVKEKAVVLKQAPGPGNHKIVEKPAA